MALQCVTDTAGISASIGAVSADHDRINAANQSAQDNRLTPQTSSTTTENADLRKTIVNLQMQQTAYQASLAATSRVMQHSLLDYLR